MGTKGGTSSKFLGRYRDAAADLAETLDKANVSDWVPNLSAWAHIADIDPSNWRRWLRENFPQLLEAHAQAKAKHREWQLEQYLAERAAGKFKHELHQKLGLPLKLCLGIDPCMKPRVDWDGLFAAHREWFAEPRKLKDSAEHMGVSYQRMLNLRVRRGFPSWMGVERVGMPLWLWDKEMHKGPE